MTTRLARSVSTNWLNFAVNVLISFFLAPFVVRHLGSIYYGIWAVALQVTGYIYLLDFGVRESVVRYTSKYVARKQHTRLSQTLTVAMIVYLPIMLIALLVTALCVWGLPHWFDIDPKYATEARWAVLFVGLTIAQTFLFNVFSGILIGLHRNDVTNLIAIIVALLRTVAIVAFLAAGYGLITLSAVQFAAAAVMGIVTAVVALRALRLAGVRFSLKLPRRRRFTAIARRVLGYGFFVLVNNIGQKTIQASSVVIVAAFLPLTSVTYYAIAGSLVDPLRNLLATTAHAFSPVASHYHTLRESEQLRRMFLTGTRLTALVALPITLAFCFLGRDFIGMWMGHEFMGPSGSVLAVLAITQMISAPHFVMTTLLYGISRPRVIAVLRVCEAIANLALSITLAQTMGLVGVALGTLIPHAIVVLIVLPLRVCPIVGLSVGTYYMSTYGRPLLAAVPFAAGAWAVATYHPPKNFLEFFALVGALSAVYLASAWFVAMTGEDRARFKGIFGRLAAAR
jgi:O-antigen/teichoic acid export membrane protein